MDLGYIGTGYMGNPMVRCLIKAGHTVAVHDVRREATTDLCELGAHWADSPREVAQSCQVVFTSLPGPVEAERVLTDPENGILAGLKPGGAWIDTTTNSPTVFRRLAEACKQRGVEVLDSPVSGRPPNMTMMVGADPDVFEKHRPVLEQMGKNVIYVGETASGCTAKLVTQYLRNSYFHAAIEGMLIGAKAGLDMNVLANLIPISAGQAGVVDRSLRVLLDGSFQSGGTLDIVAKDMDLACQLASDVEAPAPIGAIVDDALKRAQAQGWGKDGFPVVAKILEHMAGADLRSEPQK